MKLKFSIDERVVINFPKTAIGYVVAAFNNKGDSSLVEAMKQTLSISLQQSGIVDEKSLNANSEISSWQNAFKSFGVKPKSHRSSVEALVRRVIKGQNIWKISKIVDAYNVQSVESLFPMGGYDLDKIQGDITLRYGKAGEAFLPLGQTEVVPVTPQQVVYTYGHPDSDDEKVICWLWNYKDSESTCISSDTKKAIFFIDSITPAGAQRLDKAIEQFTRKLELLGAVCLLAGVVDGQNSIANLEFPDSVDELLQRAAVAANDFSSEYRPESHFSTLVSSEVSNKTVAVTSSPIVTPSFLTRYQEKHKITASVSAKVEERANPTWFINCVAIGRLQEVQELLAFNPSLINGRDGWNSSILIHAVMSGNSEVLQALLPLAQDAGISIYEANKNNKTAYSVAQDIASRTGNREMLDILEKTVEYQYLKQPSELKEKVSEATEKSQSTTPVSFLFQREADVKFSSEFEVEYTR